MARFFAPNDPQTNRGLSTFPGVGYGGTFSPHDPSLRGANVPGNGFGFAYGQQPDFTPGDPSLRKGQRAFLPGTPAPAHIDPSSAMAHDAARMFGLSAGRASQLYDTLYRLGQPGHFMGPRHYAQVVSRFGGHVPDYGDQMDYLRRAGLIR